MEIRCNKNGDRLLNIDCVNKRGLDLSKEVLWVSIGQRAAVLLAVEVGGQKKFCRSALRGQSRFEPGRLAEFFLYLHF